MYRTLPSVTADVANGAVTGTPVGGETAVKLAGQADAHLRSEGFGAHAARDRASLGHLHRADRWAFDRPSDPNWYGNAKARVFLPGTLNDLKTKSPPSSLVVRSASDEAQPGAFRVVSIQPAMP